MGSCVSVSVPIDKVVTQFSECLSVKWSYIHNLAKNLAHLKEVVGILMVKRDDLQRRVDREEYTRQYERLGEVKLWLTSVLAIENQYNDLLIFSELELQRLCLCGFCSKNLKSSYDYGERVSEMLTQVKSLIQRGTFEVVTEEAPIAKVETLPIQLNIVGQETILDEVWSRLIMDDEVRIVGLYGMGGVGKTTLLTQINNKFSKIGGRFDIVIWVVVSQDATVYTIQGGLGEKLSLLGKEWNEKNENQRALAIHNILQTKRFVLLLDDIWKEWDLSKIGVPSSVDGSKIAFTTRSRDVCGRMGAHLIEIQCLDIEKAWDLFKKNAGENILESNPDIQKLAREVAGKCHGLPLALTVIGKTMASKTAIQEWKGALDKLTSYAAEYLGMVEEILPILKYSYASLKDEEVQSCFLYYSLFPGDSLMDKESLIEYWIGERLIDDSEGRERAINHGYGIIGTLVRACLLLENNKTEVKMHDVVRDMALWIASDSGKHKERLVVRAGVGLREIPKGANWKNVRRMSLMENDIGRISESHECPELTTLLLGENKSLTISGEFFLCMPRLLVLDLSGNDSLSELPEEISRLVSLRYINLSATKIERLPICLQELKLLIHLKLEWTSKLESLQGISKFLSLRTLRLRGSRVRPDKSLMKELQLLQHFEFIFV